MTNSIIRTARAANLSKGVRPVEGPVNEDIIVPLHRSQQPWQPVVHRDYEIKIAEQEVDGHKMPVAVIRSRRAGQYEAKLKTGSDVNADRKDLAMFFYNKPAGLTA